ncbi:MAG: hypothetical protein AAB212_10315, partial [Bacteroidota bacterium]
GYLQGYAKHLTFKAAPFYVGSKVISWIDQDNEYQNIAKMVEDIAIISAIWGLGKGGKPDYEKSSIMHELFARKFKHAANDLLPTGLRTRVNAIPIVGQGARLIGEIPMQVGIQGLFFGAHAYNAVYADMHSGEKPINSKVLTLVHIFATLGAIKAWNKKDMDLYTASIKNIKIAVTDFKSFKSGMSEWAKDIVNTTTTAHIRINKFFREQYSPEGVFMNSVQTTASVAQTLTFFQPVIYLGGLYWDKFMLGKDIEFITPQGRMSPDFSYGLLAYNIIHTARQGAEMGAAFGYTMHFSRALLEPFLHRIPVFSRAMEYLNKNAGDIVIGKANTSLGRFMRSPFIGRVHTF